MHEMHNVIYGKWRDSRIRKGTYLNLVVMDEETTRLHPPAELSQYCPLRVRIKMTD